MSPHNVDLGALGLSTVCISYPHHISPTPLQTGSGITRTLINGNLDRLLVLWFERIPGVIQSTENAISDHPLLHRGVLNIEL